MTKRREAQEDEDEGPGDRSVTPRASPEPGPLPAFRPSPQDQHHPPCQSLTLTLTIELSPSASIADIQIRRSNPRRPENSSAPETKTASSPRGDAETAVSALRNHSDGLSEKDLKQHTGLGRTRLLKALKYLGERVTTRRGSSRGGKPPTLYVLVDPVAASPESIEPLGPTGVLSFDQEPGASPSEKKNPSGNDPEREPAPDVALGPAGSAAPRSEEVGGASGLGPATSESQSEATNSSDRPEVARESGAHARTSIRVDAKSAGARTKVTETPS